MAWCIVHWVAVWDTLVLRFQLSIVLKANTELKNIEFFFNKRDHFIQDHVPPSSITPLSCSYTHVPSVHDGAVGGGQGSALALWPICISPYVASCMSCHLSIIASLNFFSNLCFSSSSVGSDPMSYQWPWSCHRFSGCPFLDRTGPYQSYSEPYTYS